MAYLKAILSQKTLYTGLNKQNTYMNQSDMSLSTTDLTRIVQSCVPCLSFEKDKKNAWLLLMAFGWVFSVR